MHTLFDELFTELFPSLSRSYEYEVEKKDYHLEVELPGVKKEDIKVSLEGDFLKVVVNSPRKKINRVVRLSENEFNHQKAKVRYEDGLLIIDIPLRDSKVESRLLEIK